MTTADRTATLPPEFVTRLLVTLGALALYRLGMHVPLAGIDHAVLAELYRGSASALAIERVSILALGTTPIISALLLVELLRLASQRFDGWAGATVVNARLVDRYTLVGALLLAAFQGAGLAGALEGVSHLVTEPGLAFRIGTVATFVAGTALIAWLATVISRHGLGSGLWVLVLVPYLASLPGLAVSIFAAVQTGSMSGLHVVTALLIALCLLMAVVALAQALIAARVPLERTLIWPLFIAPVVATALASVAWFLPGSRGAAGSLLEQGTLLNAAFLTCIAVLVSIAQWNRVASSLSAEPGSYGLMVVTVLALAGLAGIPEVVAARLDVPFLIDGRTTAVAAAVGLGVLGALRASRAPR